MAKIAALQPAQEIGFVFIHGAGLNGRIWKQVVEGLGAPCLLVDLPERQGEKAVRRRLSLEDYVSHITRQINEWEIEKFIIVAHSLGGLPGLKVAREIPGRVTGYAAVGAIIPKQGGSFLSVLPVAKRALMGVLLRAFGTQPPESAIRSGLCSDLTQEQADEIVRVFAAESLRVYTDRVGAPPPGDVPKLYVKLTNDRELDSALQDRMIANLNPQHVESLASGHLPMLSKPSELRAILERFLTHCENQALETQAAD